VPLARTFEPPQPLDVALTMRALSHGPFDPTLRIEHGRVRRATRTPCGPATLELEPRGDNIYARAFGAGAEWALDAVPDLLGFDDDGPGFAPVHPVVRELHRRRPGLRLGRSGAVLEAMVPAIVEQRVQSTEAARSWVRLVRRFGAPAPGPFGLRLPPAPERLAQLPYFAFHPCGIERRRADTVRRAAAAATRLERAAALPLEPATRLLLAIPGVGPWTAAEVARVALGDRDAVSVGDWNLPHLVAWALAGERRADDARMLELLEPFRPHRARVVRLLTMSGLHPPRRAPRAALRSFAEC
jgi:3-methyladenine DNA glycosylase/8-oxoguanine DNA glycosylase